MFIRKLKSKNGKTYIQVIEKSSGRYKVLKSFGSSQIDSGISLLVNKAQKWISEYGGNLELDFTNSNQAVQTLFDSITQLNRIGPDLLLGNIFDQIGFHAVDDEIFRQLVFCRIAYPRSKLKTTEYLSRYKQIYWTEDQVYRYLDKLYNKQKELVQRISFEHTLSILNNRLSVVFYDVTTLYFEIDEEDELRKTGFSKEGKHQNPQIVLGLLVSAHGYPLAYEIFEGNKFEGHTMLPVIDAFKDKYHLPQLAIIADSGLLSKANIEELQNKGYEFILGARVKSEPDSIKKKILALRLGNGESSIIRKGNLRLIVSYSDDRAKKDRYNRGKGLRKLEKQVKTGRLTKSNINNRGYNKYLKLEGEIKVTIDREKLELDRRWDGLKGYITNADLDKDQIIENYQHLWLIEKAFRIAKSDLKIRPIYHRLQRRIEAHICISFVAYKVYKELERQLKLHRSNLSPEKAIEIADSIFEMQIKMPQNGEILNKTLLLNEEQRYLASIFNFGC